MKPTRNIVKPNTGLWKPKGSVWFKKNDDSELGGKKCKNCGGKGYEGGYWCCSGDDRDTTCNTCGGTGKE